MNEKSSSRGEWVRWGILVLFGAGMAYHEIQEIPALREKVENHETRISVGEAHYAEMHDDVAEIKVDVKKLLERR